MKISFSGYTPILKQNPSRSIIDRVAKMFDLFYKYNPFRKQFTITSLIVTDERFKIAWTMSKG